MDGALTVCRSSAPSSGWSARATAESRSHARRSYVDNRSKSACASMSMDRSAAATAIRPTPAAAYRRSRAAPPPRSESRARPAARSARRAASSPARPAADRPLAPIEVPPTDDGSDERGKRRRAERHYSAASEGVSGARRAEYDRSRHHPELQRRHHSRQSDLRKSSLPSLTFARRAATVYRCPMFWR